MNRKAKIQRLQDYCDCHDECNTCLLADYQCEFGDMRENELDELLDIISDNQAAKADAGKPRLSLVPPQIIRDVARIREYGNAKYGDPENWRTVEPERYINAAYRHLIAFAEDPKSVDEESGLPHLWHCECNLAFLSELLKDELKGVKR